MLKNGKCSVYSEGVSRPCSALSLASDIYPFSRFFLQQLNVASVTSGVGL